jgi:hypothetical protein
MRSNLPTALETQRDELHCDLSNSLEVVSNLHYLLRNSEGDAAKFSLYMSMADTQMIRLGHTSTKLRLAV